MWNKKRRIALFIMMFVLVLSVFGTNSDTVQASTTKRTYLNDNRNAQDYTDANWSDRVYDYLVKVDNGYMRVHLMWNGTAYIEYFDSAYRFVSQKVIQTELSMAGGFFEGQSNYFLVFGQENKRETDDTEVIRVVKYDKEWNRMGAVSIYGANTQIPFDCGGVRMTETNGLLYIRTGHTQYLTSDGLHHQTNMTVIIDEANMSIADQLTEVNNYSAVNKFNLAYVSHSMNQFIISDDQGEVVFLDQGDAYPRAAQIAKEVKKKYGNFEGKSIIKYAGDIGDNYTGASIGGLEYSENNYLTVGTYGEQWRYDVGNNIVYLSINDRNFQNETKLIHLTNASKKKLYTTPQLVKISPNRFLVLWSERIYDDKQELFLLNGKVCYIFVDGEGNLLGGIKRTNGTLSDCQPIVVNGQVVWTSSDNKNLRFHCIDGNGGYSCVKAEYPTEIVKYPLQVKNCHLVVKKIGGISCKTEDVEDSVLKKLFVLYESGCENPLQYGIDYTFNSFTTTTSSLRPNKRYLLGVSVMADGEQCYGNARYKASDLWDEPPVFIHERPQKVSAKRIASGVKIKWEKEPYALGYYVYRKSGNGSYKKIATISDVSKNTYTDKTAKRNISYSYYVKTYTTNGKKLITSARSEIKKVK